MRAQYIGPSLGYKAACLLKNPLTWISAGLIFVGGYVAIDPSGSPTGLAELGTYLSRHMGADAPAFSYLLIGLLFAAASYGISHIIYNSTNFYLNGRELSIETGVFYKTIDSVPLGQIYELDMHISPLESVFGSGTLIIRLVSQQPDVVVPFVPNPNSIRELLTPDRSDIRLYGSL